MLRIYRWLAAIVAALSAPVYRWTLGRRAGSPARALRMGFVDPAPEGSVWIHSVSLGEAVVARNLLGALRAGGWTGSVLWTATTPAGLEGAASAAAGMEGVAVRVFPLDTRAAVRRFLDRTQPRALVLVETEIWPVLLDELSRRGLPVMIVNARVSDRALPRFRRWSSLYRPAFKSLTCVAARTAEDARRFASLGTEAACIQECGDVKWDRPVTGADRTALVAVRQKYGIEPDNLLVVAGSTRPGEERHILGAMTPLLNRMPRLRLVIAPRHPARGQAVSEMLRGESLVAARASVYTNITRWQVLVLDTLGELMGMYGAASVCIMGGTWERFGGHNPVEPMAWGVPVIAGPHGENFREILEMGEKRGALVRLGSPQELEEALSLLLTDAQVRGEIAGRAGSLIAEMAGASGRACAMIRTFLEGAQDAGPNRTGA